MASVTTTVFRSNRTQAIRLPKAVAFPDDIREVEILVVGNARVIVPKGRRWDDFFEDRQQAPGDYLIDREQGEDVEPESL